MFNPLSVCIGLRYMRAQRKTHFISFISFTSMMGIALGVAVLITVLSVMNGFDTEIHKKFFGIAHHVSVSRFDGKMEDWRGLENKLNHESHVLATAPYVTGQGLVISSGQNLPVILSGIQPTAEKTVSTLSEKTVEGNVEALLPGSFGIVIGKELADSLGVSVGERVTVMIPSATISLAGMQPRFKRFEVVGIFNAGKGFGFDARLAYINLIDAQKLFMLGTAISGIRLKLDNIYLAPQVSDNLLAELPFDYSVTNWTEQFGPFFSAIKMEKNMMFLILMLIIGVAAFNLISSLVMLVNDKRSDIAILRTYGILPKTVMMIFIVQGMLVGLMGVGLGLILGLLLASNATSIVDHLQKLFHVQFLSTNVYFVDYLPSEIQSWDVVRICVFSLILCFLATLYPAWRASKVVPAEALRYE